MQIEKPHSKLHPVRWSFLGWIMGFVTFSPLAKIIVSPSSSRRRATVRRTVAFDGSNPIQRIKIRPIRKDGSYFYGKGTISWYNAQLQGWMHHLTSGSQGNTCLIFFLAICSLQYTKLNSPQISISSTVNVARSFRHREIGS